MMRRLSFLLVAIAGCGGQEPAPRPVAQALTQTIRVAIALSNGPKAPAHPYADADATAKMFYVPSNPASAYSFYFLSSFQGLELAGQNGPGTAADVYGPIDVDTTDCPMPGEAVAGVEKYIDFSLYDAIIVVHNDPMLCGSGGWTGSANVMANGQPKQVTASAIYNDAFGVPGSGQIGSTVLHEFGHQLGLQHGGGWECGDQTIALDGRCAGLDYDDVTDVMGSALYGDFNPPHKDMLGWLKGPNIQTVTSSTGQYTLNAYEDGAANLKVLKIPRKLDAAGNPTGFYYVAFHRPVAPWDAWLADAKQYTEGVAIYMDESAPDTDTQLLDLTPNSDTGFSDFHSGALTPSAMPNNFKDADAGVSVTVMSVTATTATVQVDLVVGRTKRYVLITAHDLWANTIPGIQMSGWGSFPYNTLVTLADSTPDYDLKYWKAPGMFSNSNPYTFASGLVADTFVDAMLYPKPPANDDFAKATPIQKNTFDDIFHNDTATTELGEPTGVACDGQSVSPLMTAWYSYTPTQDEQVHITSDGPYPRTIAVYTGQQVDMLTEVPGACSTDTPLLGVVFNASANETYWIQLGSIYANNGGLTSMHFDATP